MVAVTTATGDPPLIACIAEGLASVSLPSGVDAQLSSPQPRYESLLATAHYDAWLVHWPVGASLEPKHDPCAGAFSVVRGVLDVDALVDGGTVTRRVEPGTTLWFDTHQDHALVNRASAPATSVHVYAPPLRAIRDVAVAQEMPPNSRASTAPQPGLASPSDSGAGRAHRHLLKARHR